MEKLIFISIVSTSLLAGMLQEVSDTAASSLKNSAAKVALFYRTAFSFHDEEMTPEKQRAQAYCQRAFAEIVYHAIENSSNIPFTNANYTSVLQQAGIINADSHIPPDIYKALKYYPGVIRELALQKKIHAYYLNADDATQEAFFCACKHAQEHSESTPLTAYNSIALLQKWGFIDTKKLMDPFIYHILKTRYTIEISTKKENRRHATQRAYIIPCIKES